MSTHTPTKPRILVVDDEPGVLYATTRVLDASYQVLGAASADEALVALESFRPDLLITDIRMPGMDGFALAAHMREKSPDLDVIFMTGSRSEPDAHLIRAIQEHAFYFIQKPFDRRVLSTLVARCLELRRLRGTERGYTAHLRSELAEARAFQRAMLAPDSATLEGVRIEARCLPCVELGGDLYDYALAADGRLAFIMADVRGHGASAAMLTAIVKSVFHSPAHAYDPLRIADALAHAVAPFGDDRFVTVFCGRIDPMRRELEFVCAGHPAAILRDGSNQLSSLHSNGPILCSAFPGGSWVAEHKYLPNHWQLIVHTDGLSDSIGGSLSNQQQLITSTIAGSTRDDPTLADALVHLALSAARGHRQDGQLPDDVSVMVLTESPSVARR